MRSRLRGAKGERAQVCLRWQHQSRSSPPFPPPTTHLTGLRVRRDSLREVLAVAFRSSAGSLYYLYVTQQRTRCSRRPGLGAKPTGQDATLQRRNPAGTPRAVHQPSPPEAARGHGGSGSPSLQLSPQLCPPHGILLPRRAGRCSGVCRVSQGSVSGTARPAASQLLTGGTCRSCLASAALLRGPHDQPARRELCFGSIFAASYEA